MNPIASIRKFMTSKERPPRGGFFLAQKRRWIPY